MIIDTGIDGDVVGVAGPAMCSAESEELMEHLWVALYNWSVRLSCSESLFDCFCQLVHFCSSHLAADTFTALVVQPWNYFILLMAMGAIDGRTQDSTDTSDTSDAHDAVTAAARQLIRHNGKRNYGTTFSNSLSRF